jgi:phospholipid/cholesterol/gamma-HCH transport system ATP-binding protein
MITKVEIRDLTHEFDTGKKVFDGLSSELPMNEIVLLDGGTGSGRSTLLKMVAALIMPSSGSVVINDQPISELTFEEFLPTRLKIGYSFEYAGLLSNRTLRENLLLPIRYHSVVSPREAEKRVDELLKIFGLSHVSNQRPYGVSGSQRKACVLARAFVLNPELVLLDEPFGGLSQSAIETFKDFVMLMRKNANLKHVFMTCQNPRDVEGWATKKLFIEANRITCSRIEKSKGAA